MTQERIGSVLVKVKQIDEVISKFHKSFDGQEHYVYKYRVTCINKDTGKRISFSFYGSINDHTNGDPYPENLMESVLCCIRNDYSNTREEFPTLESFAREFGYDLDDREERQMTNSTYKKVVELADKLQSVFTEDLMELLPQ